MDEVGDDEQEDDCDQDRLKMDEACMLLDDVIIILFGHTNCNTAHCLLYLLQKQSIPENHHPIRTFITTASCIDIVARIHRQHSVIAPKLEYCILSCTFSVTRTTTPPIHNNNNDNNKQQQYHDNGPSC